MIPLEELPTFAAVLCLGIFIQSATGFAAGLIIMPLMLWAGQGIPEAQAAMLAATIPQNVLGCFQFRSTVNTKQLLLPAALRFCALPVGVAALYSIDDFPVVRLRQIVGAVVIACVMTLLIVRPKPQQHLHVGWTWLAFSVSGFFAACTGTGGPMMVLWVQAHDWSTERMRAFLFVMYLLSIPPLFLLLYYTFGNRIVRSAVSAAALVPVLFAVTWIGLRVGSWLGRERLRKVTMGLLLLIGGSGLFAPMIAHLANRVSPFGWSP